MQNILTDNSRIGDYKINNSQKTIFDIINNF